jgi:hypothetical protein
VGAVLLASFSQVLSFCRLWKPSCAGLADQLTSLRSEQWPRHPASCSDALDSAIAQSQSVVGLCADGVRRCTSVPIAGPMWPDYTASALSLLGFGVCCADVEDGMVCLWPAFSVRRTLQRVFLRSALFEEGGLGCAAAPSVVVALPH